MISTIHRTLVDFILELAKDLGSLSKRSQAERKTLMEQFDALTQTLKYEDFEVIQADGQPYSYVAGRVVRAVLLSEIPRIRERLRALETRDLQLLEMLELTQHQSSVLHRMFGSPRQGLA